MPELRYGKTDSRRFNIAAKRVTLIAILYVLPPTNQTCLATNQLVAGCEKLLQKVGSSSTFCNKICTCGALYLHKANLFCSK